MANRGKVRSSRRKVKGRMKFVEYMKLVRKDSVQTDTLKRVEGKPPADVGPTFRIKIRKK